MEFTEKDMKRIALTLLVLVLAVLVFFTLKPVLFAIIGGLILAYIFFPVYKWIEKRVKYKSLAAALVSVIVLIIIFLPLWFLAPVMMERIFEVFQFSQEIDIGRFVASLIPKVSDQLANQISEATNNAINKLTSLILNSIVEFLLDFGVVALNLLLVAFVFFFALREEAVLREFVSGLSPLDKTQEKALLKQFKDITQSIVYGQIVIGIIQGILAGLGLFIFKVPHAIVLTAIAITLSIIPVIGPSLVYIPVTAYLLFTVNPLLAIGYLLYNVLFVSSVDNILRTHWVSRKTQLSHAIVLIGMVGGLFTFGILGLILGPLILAYFITFLKAYKDKTLSTFFSA